MASSDEMIARELKRELAQGRPAADLWQRVERGLLQARRRKRLAVGAAGAALVLVLALALPSGRGLVLAAAHDALAQIVELYSGLLGKFRTGSNGFPEHTHLALNEEVTLGSPAREAERVTLLATTVAGLSVSGLDWPLPAYLGPAAGNRVGLLRAWDADGNLIRAGVEMTYPVQSSAGVVEVYYQLMRHELYFAPHADNLVPQRINPDLPVDGNPDVRYVTIHGNPALARQDGGQWSIEWAVEGVTGILRAPLPLDELVQVAESLPGLR